MGATTCSATISPPPTASRTRSSSTRPAAILFRIGPSGRVFVDPMFLVSAGFHRLGLSVALAYLVWLPVAAAVFALGPYAYARARLGDPWAAAAAALIGLFFVGPHFLAAHWSGVIP